MADTAIETEKTQTPKKEKQQRVRSTIDFPYTAMDSAITLAKAVHALGSECDWAQLGARLDMAADGGGFRQRLQAAKMFGVITYSSGTVTLTQLGAQINDPDQLAAAKVQSFLNVALYKAIYDEYRTTTLPGAEGLENRMVALGVPEKQKVKARQAFQRSATDAGFFAYGQNRLVQPTVRTLKPAATPPADAGSGDEGKEKNTGNGNYGGGAGGGGGEKRHPFIEGLLETLPPAAIGAAKSEWSLRGRQDWLQTAAGVFNLIYKIADNDEGTVQVSVEPPKSSAN
jgi:hypothetical protein